MALLDEIRGACADLAARAQQVAVVEAAVPAYAAALPLARDRAPLDVPGADREARAAFVLTLDAINFGSGWFPTLRKRSGLSGYRTVEAGLRERFAARGPWSADELRALPRREVAHVTDQDPGHELVGLWTEHLRALGHHVGDELDGRFGALADLGSAEAVVERLARWPSFADASAYEGLAVPLFKRAQIAAADLQLSGVARFDDVHRLTLFADNLVPHVLRLDGVLRLAPDLAARIEAEELLEHGSPEEVEIRACALHAVELNVASRGDATAAEVDGLLWHRGGEPRYKARPRHRARCSAY